jgi:plasmid stability protein
MAGLADASCEGFMATLYVKNVPRDVYAALRNRAQRNHRSIASEVRELLGENVPPARELKARQIWFRRLVRLRARQPKLRRKFPSTEEMIREDRER